ncbi:transcriptional regulator [Ruegeria sp. HKCCA5929]|uniref:HVO_A0114 family putative DNA-binding protein n=1 Tax=Ruegeria sp. HKCCA5929 TaxID=2682988 RepID=UPI00148938DB|nr:transcriptional regulator [Ruegeria sp. HKCCA5929]
MKTLKVGIMTYDQMKERTMAIARGEYKPKSGEPTVWFNSVESFSKVLSARNRELLAIIARERPKSLGELEYISGRKKANLSRTLKTMSKYGLVKLEKGHRGAVKPRVPFGKINLDLDLRLSA